VWERFPSTQAFADLLTERSTSRPSKSRESRSEMNVVTEPLLAARKRLAILGR
jgi:hypothetical protein